MIKVTKVSASRLSCIVALGLWELRERKVVKIKQKKQSTRRHTHHACVLARLPPPLMSSSISSERTSKPSFSLLSLSLV
jgi:hypothetical protein